MAAALGPGGTAVECPRVGVAASDRARGRQAVSAIPVDIARSHPQHAFRRPPCPN
jgi:hypothetical protein